MDYMDLNLAHNLVWDALRSVSDYAGSTTNEHLTLEELGLTTAEQCGYFKTALVARVEAMGYQIDPADIPIDPLDTPGIVASVLPGKATKGNTI